MTIRLISFLNRFISLKMGLIGAVIMGAVVLFINLDHGWGPASIAGLKQAAYTLLFGGLIIKMLETLAMKINSRVAAILVSTLLTSMITIGLVYLVHSLRGTPKPFESTLPTIILAPPGFFAIAFRKRNKV